MAKNRTSFQPGQTSKPGPGRPKGSLNKATAEAHEIMARLGCNPIESMIRIVNDDVPCSTCRGKGTTRYQPATRKTNCYLCGNEGMVQGNVGPVPCPECGGKPRTKPKELGERTCESCYGSGKEKISPELKGKMLTELAQYSYPKRKAIDLAVSGMETIAERMKRAQARLKANDQH